MEEIWRPIIGYEELYEVSSLGRVRHLKFNRFLSPRIRSGYWAVSLNKNNKQKSVSIHRIMAESFMPKIKECVNHIDGNKLNNNLENLEWVLYRENSVHRDLKRKTKTGQSNIVVHGKSFQVRVRYEKKYIHLGTFSNLNDAIIKRNNFYKQHNISNKYI